MKETVTTLTFTVKVIVRVPQNSAREVTRAEANLSNALDVHLGRIGMDWERVGGIDADVTEVDYD